MLDEWFDRLITEYIVKKDDPVNKYMFLYCPKHNTIAIKTYEEIANDPFIRIKW